MSVPAVDWRGLRGDLRNGVLAARGAHHPLTWRRATALVVSGVLFAYARVSLLLHWSLDELLFRRWRHQPLGRPVFLVGNFRSGTTLLSRMVDQGAPDTTAQTTWEIYLAPTVSGRLFWRGVAYVDRALGGWGARVVARVNRAALNRVPYHPIDLFKPEEDAGGLMQVWSGFFTWFLFPRRGVVPDVAMIDGLPDARRRRAMRWYQAAVRKHLYAYARRYPRRAAPVFIAKNPAFTGAIGTLRHWFPGARCATIERNREATRRSALAWFGVWFALLGARRTAQPEVEVVDRLMDRWYRHPRDLGVHVVDYHRLVDDPRSELAALTAKLDLPWLAQPHALRRALGELARDHGSTAPSRSGGRSAEQEE